MKQTLNLDSTNYRDVISKMVLRPGDSVEINFDFTNSTGRLDYFTLYTHDVVGAQALAQFTADPGTTLLEKTTKVTSSFLNLTTNVSAIQQGTSAWKFFTTVIGCKLQFNLSLSDKNKKGVTFFWDLAYGA